MQIDPLAQVGNVLRALIRHARDVVFIDKQHGGMMAAADRQLLHIDDGAVRDAPHALEPGAAFALEFCRALRLAPQERITTGSKRAAAGNNQRVKSQ
jgi:hypothetical protein